MTLRAGEVFAGYTVVARLGVGGFGEVYLVNHPRLPRQDALKVLRSEISADADFRRRFIREADSVATLTHPNIVTVFDRGEADGRLWITTQFVDGPDAAHLLRAQHPNGMPADEAASIITEIAEALDYAHRSGVLHRDVKPANILLNQSRDGRRRAILGDFGIARPLVGPSVMTATNHFVGTVTYAAPEQLLGGPVDSRADQYALAATAFHLLAGVPPVRDSNPVAVISKRLTLPPPRLAAIRPDLIDLDAVLSKAMANHPGQRYPSCAKFARELSRYLIHSPVAPHDTTQHAVSVPPSPPSTGRIRTPLPPDAARRISAGYACKRPSINLGSVVVGGTVDPSAQIRIPLAMMNRHGLVAGATGTGKTKTLQVIAEQLSAAGVPVLMADFKGDLSGLSRPGETNDKVTQRAADTGDEWVATPYPVEFLSLGTGGLGVPVRATISAFGPILLSKVLGLKQTEESSLGLIFHYADQQGLPLLDLKDLRQVITFLTITDEGKAQLKSLGAVSSETAGVILRALINLEAEGGDTFFGEPELDPADLLRVDAGGRGIISLFELGDQAARPVMFSTFLMWVLADLFTYLPEVGDVDKPKLVFVFDEAHLLFKDASKAFLEQVEQTVKLIRSKGVGVFFCTQLPTDIPNAVLSQLGARVQHALRTFTPDDQQALSKTVRTYPETEFYDLATDLTALGTGEAIVTVLSERGAPTPVAWTRVRSPGSLMDTIGPDSIKAAAQASPLFLKYGPTVDRESAYEMLAAKVAPSPGAGAEPAPAGDSVDVPPRPESVHRGEPSVLEQMMENPAFKSAMRSAGTVIGREITRSVFGTGRRRRQ